MHLKGSFSHCLGLASIFDILKEFFLTIDNKEGYVDDNDNDVRERFIIKKKKKNWKIVVFR